MVSDQDQEKFQSGFLRESEEFSILNAAPGSQASRLESFVREISFQAYDGLEDQELRARANAFACELEGKPLPVTVTAFIDGLSISESLLRVSDAVTLRKPTPEDVAEHIDVDEHGGFNFPLGQTWFRVVGEFVFDAVSTGAAQHRFLRTIEALRLFRAGGVATNRYRMTFRHFLSGGILFGAGRHSRFNYTLSMSDVSPLAGFLNDIEPLLSDPLQMDQATTDIGVAHARYVDALFQSGAPERTITSAIIALEAIFLKNEPKLSHRLAQRVSVFLGLLGTQPDLRGVYTSVKSGYKIRSTFIHGGSLKPKDRPQAESLAPVLVEYARQCLLVRVQQNMAKDELLGKLDDAKIDPVAEKDLDNLLGSVAHR
jgi:hypothetical protein